MNSFDQTTSSADTWISSEPDRINIVREYCWLATRRNLSDEEADRLAEILELSEDDGYLDFWINEVDHFLDHELRLTSRQSIYSCENQKAILRKYLDFQWTNDAAAELIQELKEYLHTGSEEIQQRLKRKGFDPGPIDGVSGPRTKAALIKFQKAHQLRADGIVDVATQAALGLI